MTGQKMPAYIGTKIVCAMPTSKDEFRCSHSMLEGMPFNDEPGYLVVYPDGYESWSPKATFEAAYRLVSDDEKKLI